MNLFIKQHKTEKIPTSKGAFLGLPKSQSTRNLEVGDYFCIFNKKDDLMVFIQKEWHKLWFLNIVNETVIGEIEYNILTDKTNIVESTNDFIHIYNKEINKLKHGIKNNKIKSKITCI